MISNNNNNEMKLVFGSSLKRWVIQILFSCGIYAILNKNRARLNINVN